MTQVAEGVTEKFLEACAQMKAGRVSREQANLTLRDIRMAVRDGVDISCLGFRDLGQAVSCWINCPFSVVPSSAVK